MNTNPPIQAASVIISFSRGLTRLQMLNLVSAMDYSAHPRIREITGVTMRLHYLGEVRASVCYNVECPRTEDVRPILESFMEAEAYKSGDVARHRVIGATRS